MTTSYAHKNVRKLVFRRRKVHSERVQKLGLGRALRLIAPIARKCQIIDFISVSFADSENHDRDSGI